MPDILFDKLIGVNVANDLTWYCITGVNYRKNISQILNSVDFIWEVNNDQEILCKVDIRGRKKI